MKSYSKKLALCLFFFIIIQFFLTENVLAADLAFPQTEISPFPNVSISFDGGQNPDAVSSTLQLLFLFTIISLAPYLLVTLTCFTRIIIALHFFRSAIGTQQMPPNQVLLGLALFITFFLMGPTFSQINEEAIKPYTAGLISQQEAIDTSMEPIREFMFNQVADKDMALFIELSGESYATMEEVPNRVLIPAFILTELTYGFKFGVIVYIPFIVIDMIVASVLMAMGMMMLPPAMISLPFKVLLFVLADGWTLVLRNLILTFQ